jgi:hypothetical protein
MSRALGGSISASEVLMEGSRSSKISQEMPCRCREMANVRSESPAPMMATCEGGEANIQVQPKYDSEVSIQCKEVQATGSDLDVFD